LAISVVIGFRSFLVLLRASDESYVPNCRGASALQLGRSFKGMKLEVLNDP
jgi:hypothetical protein